MTIVDGSLMPKSGSPGRLSLLAANEVTPRSCTLDACCRHSAV